MKDKLSIILLFAVVFTVCCGIALLLSPDPSVSQCSDTINQIVYNVKYVKKFHICISVILSMILIWYVEPSYMGG